MRGNNEIVYGYCRECAKPLRKGEAETGVMCMSCREETATELAIALQHIRFGIKGLGRESIEQV